MSIKIFGILLIALFGAVALNEAYPQEVRFQRLPYYPPPTQPPRPIRVRRQALSGSIATNPVGGADAKLELARGIGTEDHHVLGKVFAAGNTNGGPVATGGALSYKNGPLGASISKEHIPGARDTVTKSLNANLFNNGPHSLDANLFKSHNTQLNNGFKYDRNGYGLDYSHANGHSAGFTNSKIPGIGSQLELNGRANIWSSADRNTRLDLTGGGSKWTSGPFKGNTNWNTGLGLTHYFG